jgi:enoyl-CoA hydratase
MSDDPIRVEHRDPVAVLTIRHGRANALDLELCRALVAALGRVEREGAVVLTGSGSIFSAGVDLRRVMAGGAAYVREFLPLLREAFERLAFFERPVVAAVNGHAMAGGFILLAAADQAVLVSEGARIGVTELKVGVPFPRIALELVRMRVGEAEAARLVYRASTVLPEEALSRGMVDELAPADTLLDRAVELATELSATGPAFRLAKRQLRRPIQEALAGRADVDAQVEAVWQADQTLAAIRRYAEAVLGAGTRS